MNKIVEKSDKNVRIQSYIDKTIYDDLLKIDNSPKKLGKSLARLFKEIIITLATQNVDNFPYDSPRAKRILSEEIEGIKRKQQVKYRDDTYRLRIFDFLDTEVIPKPAMVYALKGRSAAAKACKNVISDLKPADAVFDIPLYMILETIPLYLDYINESGKVVEAYNRYNIAKFNLESNLVSNTGVSGWSDDI